MVLKPVDIHLEKMNLDTHFPPYTKTNSTCIIDINVKVKIIKLLEGNLEEYFHNFEQAQFGIGKVFTNKMHREIKKNV